MSSEQTEKTEVPPPTLAEMALTRTNVRLGRQQEKAAKQQAFFQQGLQQVTDPAIQGIPSDLEQISALSGPTLTLDQQNELLQADFQLQRELQRIALEETLRGPGASPEQEALIREAANRAIASGEADIARGAQAGIQGLARELAPSLGLRPSDTPIVDRGQQITNEAQQLQAQLVNNIRGQEAQNLLNFPLAAAESRASTLGAQQGISGRSQEAARAASEFQAQLLQQAFGNRLALAGETGRLGLGLATGFNAPQALNVVQQPRLAQTETTKKGLTAEKAQIVSSHVSGLASSKTIKKDKRPVDEREVLDRVRDLDVERWRYIGDDREHIGPYAEDFRDRFGVGDGRTIHIVDAIGIGLAATKALAEDVSDIKEGLGLTHGASRS